MPSANDLILITNSSGLVVSSGTAPSTVKVAVKVTKKPSKTTSRTGTITITASTPGAAQSPQTVNLTWQAKSGKSPDHDDDD